MILAHRSGAVSDGGGSSGVREAFAAERGRRCSAEAVTGITRNSAAAARLARRRRGAVAALVAALAACTPSLAPREGATVAEVLASVEPPPDPVARAEEPVGAPREVSEFRADGSRWRCTVQRYAGALLTERFLPAARAESVWPGSLVESEGAGSGAPAAIPLDRGAGALFVEAASPVQADGEALTAVSVEAVRDARDRLLLAIEGEHSGGFEATFLEAATVSQLAAALGTTPSQLEAAVGKRIELSTDGPYTRFAVRLDQPFYTLRFAPPAARGDTFALSVSGSDLAAHVGPGNPPAYLHAVTFGRTFLVLLESKLPEQEVLAAVAALGGSPEAATPVALAAVARLSGEARVRGYVVGGEADPDFQAALGSNQGPLLGLRELAGVRATLGPQRPGVPTSYSARRLTDDQTVRAAVPTSYDRRSCVPVE